MAIVEYEKEGHLVTVTLNRPERLNALDLEMMAALREAWIRYRADDDAWVAILTGAGRAFTAGADKSLFENALSGQDQDMLGDFLAATERDPFWSGTLDKPVIAATRGPVIGAGLDMLLRTDLRVAGESSVFQQPEVQLGNIVVFYDNLPDAIAAEIMCGFKFTARRACELGMVNRVVPDDQVLAAARELADELLSRPPIVLHRALKILRDLKHAGVVVPRSMLNHYTTEFSKGVTKTEDWKEGVSAFLQKRKPVYRKR